MADAVEQGDGDGLDGSTSGMCLSPLRNSANSTSNVEEAKDPGCLIRIKSRNCGRSAYAVEILGLVAKPDRKEFAAVTTCDGPIIRPLS